jgi:gliding motility-associated-like protein
MKRIFTLNITGVAFHLLICFSSVQAQLTANFSAPTQAGCAPLLVNFTDASMGNPDEWEWDLGNGTISYFQHPSVTYFNPGTYTIRLTIRKGTTSSTVTKTQYITVNAPPVIDFTQSAPAGCFPLKVTFTNQSIPGSSTVATYLWDFGDGTTSTQEHPEHIYNNAGEYNISLKAVNSDGCTATVTRLKAINIQMGVQAAFTVGTASSCQAPATVPFTNTSTGTGVLSYSWDFGDGSHAAGLHPVHAYASAGHYVVQLTTTNNTGCSNTFTKTVDVGTSTGSFNAPAVSCVNEPVTFTNTSLANPVSVAWNFGDGAVNAGTAVTHAYAGTGPYIVTQVTRFDNCVDTKTKTIQIIPRTTVDFNTPVIASCKAPFTAVFTANAPGAVAYEWNFGDGTTSTQPQPSHIFTKEGAFTIKLIITNSAGCKDSTEKVGYIVIRTPVVRIVDIPQEGCVPFSFSPTLDTTPSVTRFTGFLWDFGDGNTGTGPKPVNIYTQKGIYPVSVTYTTQDGCQGTVIKNSLIKVGNKVTVAFSASPLQVCASDPIQFTDLSIGNPPGTNPIEEWYWQFGDGGGSGLQNPAHVFTDTGRMSVSLTVKSSGCPSWATYINYVHISPPIARFEEGLNCNQPYRRSFRNTSLFDRSLAPLSFQWDFGDGGTANIENPSHVYAAKGEYIVVLTVVNGGCRHTVAKRIFIVDNVFDFTATADTVCPNTAVTFTRTISDNTLLLEKYISSNYSAQTWYNNPSVTETFVRPGLYTVFAVIIDTNKCSKVINRQVKVIGTKAVLNGPPVFCINTPAVLGDLSIDEPVIPVINRLINFGDGSPDETNPPSFKHTYVQDGSYTVTLQVTDNKGCSNTSIKNIFIANPKADFMSPDSMSCTGKNIAFKSIGPSSYSYTWDFGDGQTTSGPNPTHNYSSEGTYKITLGYTDQYGCSNAITKLNYVEVHNPVAAFSINANQSTCPPLVVQFTNQSQNMNSLEWDFGDGNTSTLADPVHFYTYPGEYWPVMKVMSKGGCVDVIQDKKITINGPRGTLTYNKTDGCAPVTVDFKGNTTDQVSFIWDFNDGATAATADPKVTYTYTRPGTYLPRMILKDASGCQVPVSGKDLITVYGVQAKFTTDKQSLCDRGIIRFEDISISNDLITNYLWTLGDGTTSTSKIFSHQYLAVGDYPVKLAVTTLHNCKSDVQGAVPLQVIPSPRAGITGPKEACVPVGFQFTGALLNANPYPLSWSWNFDNGQTAATQAPPVVAYDHAGSYQVSLTITNSYNCKGTALYPIVIHPLPLIDAGNDIVVCRDQPKLLQASGAVNYTWTSAGNMSCSHCSSTMVNPSSSVKYYVEGESAFGCKAADSVMVTVQQPITVTSNRGDTLCTGEWYRLRATGADLYSWTPVSGLDDAHAATPIAKPLATTLYQVIGKDKYNCFSDTAYVPLIVYPYPTIALEEQKTVTVGNSLTLQPVLSADVKNITWSPATWLNCVDCPSPTSTPKQTIQYRLQVANEGGCIAEDAITLLVVCGGENMFLPNTFTPNGDGINDVFYPRGKGISYIKKLFIYNRWGEEVYKQLAFYSNDIAKGWNGVYKGAPANEDVFVYIIEVVCENGQTLTFKGDVTLIR